MKHEAVCTQQLWWRPQPSVFSRTDNKLMELRPCRINQWECYDQLKIGLKRIVRQLRFCNPLIQGIILGIRVSANEWGLGMSWAISGPTIWYSTVCCFVTLDIEHHHYVKRSNQGLVEAIQMLDIDLSTITLYRASTIRRPMLEIYRFVWLFLSALFGFEPIANHSDSLNRWSGVSISAIMTARSRIMDAILSIYTAGHSPLLRYYWIYRVLMLTSTLCC